MFGDYLGDPHTVAVDTNGNIVSVMKGNDAGTLRTIKVDSNARMESVMKGLFGSTFKTLATDTNGNLIAILKGASGNNIAVDASGYLTAVMHGDQGAVAQDASNKLISVMQGSQGINIAQQATTGELKSVMQGQEGATLRTVAVDGSGNIVAVIKGDYAGALQTVKLDSEHRMITRSLNSIDTAIHARYTDGAEASVWSVDSDVVPSGKLWHITAVGAMDSAAIPDFIYFIVDPPGANNRFYAVKNPPQGSGAWWNGHLWVTEGQFIRVTFTGIAAGHGLYFYVNGSQINAT